MTEKEMYVDFRKTIANLVYPSLVRFAGNGWRQIRCDGKQVGFLCVTDGYVEGIYVEPTYRRRGLARKAVMDYLADGWKIDRLHIVGANKGALAFWESMFVLLAIQSDDVETLYLVGKDKTDLYHKMRERLRCNE